MKKYFILSVFLVFSFCYAKSQTTHQYSSNQMAALIHDLRNAQSGDVFQLTSPGGIYVVDSAYLPVTTDITIEALPGLSKKPIIKLVQGGLSSQVDYLIRFTGRNVSLTLKGIELQGDSTASKYAVRTAKIGDFGVYSGYTDLNYDKQPIETYNLTIDNCNFNGFTEGSYGYAINLYPGTLGKNVTIENSTFSQITRNAVEAYINTSQIKAHGYWQFVDTLNINNCTFYNIGRAAIEIKSTDTSAVSGLNNLIINHATFDSCAWDNSNPSKYHTLMVDYVDAKISNCIFSDDVSTDYIFELTNSSSEVNTIGVWNLGDGTGMSDTISSKGTVANIYSGDPGYQDRAAGNFMLSSNSPFLGKATDGHALGDLRWDPDYSTGIQQITANNKELVVYASGSDVYIKFKNNNSPSGTVILENISGQVVYRNVFNGTNQQVLHTQLSPGIYIVVVKMKNGLILSKKIIIS